MTRGTTLVASTFAFGYFRAFGRLASSVRAFGGLLATQQSTFVMPSCLITEHGSDCAYSREPAFGQ